MGLVHRQAAMQHAATPRTHLRRPQRHLPPDQWAASGPAVVTSREQAKPDFGVMATYVDLDAITLHDLQCERDNVRRFYLNRWTEPEVREVRDHAEGTARL